MRTVLIAVGLLSLALALLGVLLPLLPTTPFLILAAGCFSRASNRMHAWLLRLPVAGRMLDDYERLGGLTRESRRTALLLVWCGIAVSAATLSRSPALIVVLAAVAVLASAIIAKLPAARADRRADCHSTLPEASRPS